MPEFLSRTLEWFRGRSSVQKSLIGAGVLVVLIAASRVFSVSRARNLGSECV